MPTMLPRSSAEAGIVVFTERLENLNITREYCIRSEIVFKALQWLIKNNPLFRDVIVDNDDCMDEQDFIRVDETAQLINHQNYDDSNAGSSYMPITEMSRIIRASWHQGNKEVLTTGYAGVQCCAMVVANIIQSAIFPSQIWTANTLNLNMIEGDKLYETVRASSGSIPESGYLLISDFNGICNINIFDRAFSLEYSEATNLFGNVNILYV
ncbi:hypothetical protein AVEN_9390-1 [Araneus ventricosus]|uniref:DUF6570 domain-containing protein n=1 Tax=Araneus ventricosus TaxID=182803 RepID=A0A4Y2DJ43_ARAVE|nr:hypothetical protein AVEN_9390-1 [Araneus ventricosus]